MESKRARSRRGARPRPRLHAASICTTTAAFTSPRTDANSPACSRAWCATGRCRSKSSRSSATAWAGWWRAAPATTGRVAGHEWPRRSEAARLPRHAAPRRAARARRQLGGHRSWATAPTRRRWPVSARSAAPASPTCATATCWTRTGPAATASNARQIHAGRFPCPKAWGATRWPPWRERASATPGPATGSYRPAAPWAAMKSQGEACLFQSPGAGSSTAPITSTCSASRQPMKRSRNG